jgi:hypothetical protein
MYSYGTVRTAQYFLAAILSRFGGIIDSAQYCTAAAMRWSATAVQLWSLLG